MTEREKIAARIRALRDKTVANGCTEAEALAASEMLARLLEKYNLTLDEAELRASPFDRFTRRYSGAVADRLWKIADAAAFVTGARYWDAHGSGGHGLNFFGFAHEVEVGGYLLEICAAAMQRELHRYEKEICLFVGTKRARLVTGFLDGMADRLWLRIRAMKPPQPPGKGLVVVHDELVNQAMKDMGLQLESGQANRSRFSSAGYRAGLAAGEGVPLNSAVGCRDIGLRLT